jgi:peptidyl-prolyl cis-trans isomerase C
MPSGIGFFLAKNWQFVVGNIMTFAKTLLAFGGLFFLVSQVAAQSVLKDQGIGMSQQELEIMVSHWTPSMQHAAANDLGDRFELLSRTLAQKKLAAESRKFTPEMDPGRYWENQFRIMNIESKFAVDTYMAQLEVPDMSALAEEAYLSSKEKYALIPEERKTSHILLRCAPPECKVDERRVQAEQVLAQLQAGGDFKLLAAEFSEDPGSKDKGGVFDLWLQQGMERVEPHYVEGAFTIGTVGEYSGIVESQFGFHIIRLDDIKPEGYKPYVEVREEIIASLELEYKKLAAKEFDAQYRLSDKAYIDAEAMEQIFAPYKSGNEAPAPQ